MLDQQRQAEHNKKYRDNLTGFTHSYPEDHAFNSEARDFLEEFKQFSPEVLPAEE